VLRKGRDESGLRVVHLGGDELHRLVGNGAIADDDRQLIARVTLVAEHVHGVQASCHGSAPIPRLRSSIILADRQFAWQ